MRKELRDDLRVVVSPGLTGGAVLTDPDWLAEQVALTARRYPRADRRTAATLWWYSTSLLLLGPAVHALVRTGAGLDLSAPAVRIRSGPGRLPAAILPGDELPPGAEVFGRHLESALARVIDPLAEVGSTRHRPLWAIAADALATRTLAETSITPAGSAAAPVIAQTVARAAASLRPLPRFEDVRPAGSTDATPARYVRRGSCCSIYRAGEPLCLSCPRQPPAQRLDRLARHAARIATGRW